MSREIRNTKYVPSDHLGQEVLGTAPLQSSGWGEIRRLARLLGVAVILYCIFSHSHSALAAGRGTTAAEFLKIGASGRQAAMGDTSVGLADDANASLTNPAAWGLLRRNEASLLRTEWLDGISYTGAVYGHSSKSSGNWGGSVLWLDIPDTEGYDVRGSRTGDVKAEDKALALGHGRTFGYLTAGANVKLIQQDLNGFTARAWAMDSGVHWRVPWETPSQRFTLGAAVRNVGGKVKFIDQAGALPFSVDLGVGYHALQDVLRAGIDLSLARESGAEVRLGTEYWIGHALAIRTGFKPDQDLGTGLSFGIGVRVNQVHFDYAMSNFGDLDTTHRLSLRFRFGGQVAEDYSAALADVEQGETLSALGKLRRILDSEPFNREALTQMRLLKQLSAVGTSGVEPSPYQEARKLFEQRQYLAAMDKSLDALIKQPERGDEIRQLVMAIGVQMQNQSPQMTVDEREQLNRLLDEGRAAVGVKSQAFQQKEYRQAERFYEQGQYLRAYHLFDNLRTHGSAFLRSKAHDYNEAINRAMSIQANQLGAPPERVFYAKAFLAFLEGNYSQAGTHWQQVLRHNPQNEEAALYLGLIQEKPDDAFLKTRVAFLLRSGSVDFREGRYEVAHLAWREALALDPENTEIIGRLQVVLAKLFEEAKKSYRQGEWQRTVELLENIARDKELSLTSRRLLEDAKQRLKAPQEPAPAKPALERKKRPAVPAVSKPALSPTKALALYQEGFVAYARGSLDEAIRLWEEAVRLDPESRRYQEALERARLDKKILSK